MFIALGRTAVALPAICRIAVTLMTAPVYCGIALLHGGCWLSLVYGIVATRTFRRSSLSAILFLYLWAGVTLIDPKDLAVIRHLSEAALILGLILMAVNRTPREGV